MAPSTPVLDADVVVVGCGPVGVMAGLRCAQRGLRVIALDRSIEVYPLPRAIGMDQEIQDLFARAGLIEPLREHSTPLLGADFVDAQGTRIVGMDVPPGTVGPLGHPPTTMFDQPSVERFLRAAAVDAGVDMRLGVEATAVVSEADRAQLTLADGTTLAARWVIGADGARSTIRDLAGISLIDQEFDQAWLVVDTTLLDPELDLPPVARQHCDPARVVTFVPGHAMRRRWEFQLKEHESPEVALEPGFLAALLEPWGTAEQLQVDRVAVYRFHGVVAESLRQSRVFLAGDAAHQMPPFNGQGMCSGMRDAENLAWKLATVAAGNAGDRLLDTYDEERRPHATSQVAHSVDAGKLFDAIAYGGKRALESGYGRRKDPRIEYGLIDSGPVEPTHRLVGRPVPRPTSGISIGNNFSILLGHDADTQIPALWTELGAAAHRLAVDDFPDVVDPQATVIVRPDRIVAAVTTDLAGTTGRLSPLFTVS